MHTAGILHQTEDESQLWKLTWDRIDSFLPSLREEVFKTHENGLWFYWVMLWTIIFLTHVYSLIMKNFSLIDDKINSSFVIVLLAYCKNWFKILW